MELSEKLAVTRDEAAELVGVGVRTISEAIHSGRLRAKKIGGGRQYRIAVDDLREWFQGLPDA